MSVGQERLSLKSHLKQEENLKWGRNYRIAIALLGGIPLSLGMKIRHFLYQGFFKHLGNDVQIEPNVEFTRTYRISLQKGVYIRAGANLEVCSNHSELSLGERVRLDRGANIMVHDRGRIEIGDRTYIGPYSCIAGQNVTIGKDCRIASHCGINASNHIFADPNQKISAQGRSYQGIVIEDDCWIGGGVRILDGVTIARGSVVGAGAVVTKDIPPYSVAVGVPAKVISKREGNSQMSESS